MSEINLMRRDGIALTLLSSSSFKRTPIKNHGYQVDLPNISTFLLFFNHKQYLPALSLSLPIDGVKKNRFFMDLTTSI